MEIIMEYFYADYGGISLSVQSELFIEKEKLTTILEHYLPGVSIEQEESSSTFANVRINVKKSEIEKGSWKDVSINSIVAEINTQVLKPFLILGIWTSTIDYFLQDKGIFFFHSACGIIQDKGVLFWGKRADGKSTLSSEISNRKHILLHDDRVGLNHGSFRLTNSKIPVLEETKIQLLLTPKIFSLGELRYWKVSQHSLRYELYCELSQNIRCVGTIEGKITMPSIDNDSLSSKRLDFCEKLSARLKDAAFFIEGTPQDVIHFIETFPN